MSYKAIAVLLLLTGCSAQHQRTLAMGCGWDEQPIAMAEEDIERWRDEKKELKAVYAGLEDQRSIEDRVHALTGGENAVRLYKIGRRMVAVQDRSFQLDRDISRKQHERAEMIRKCSAPHEERFR